MTTLEHLDLGDVRLAFERSGATGDPVALVHGGWDDLHTWDRVTPALAGSLQTLTYDRRAHGASFGPRRTRPVRDDAADLAGLLEASGCYPAHIVGHTYGGAVALRLAVDRPELVRSVTVYEVPFVALLADSSLGGRTLQAQVSRIRAVVGRGEEEAGAREYLEHFGSAEERWSAVEPSTRQAYAANARNWGDEMGDPEATGPSMEELRAVAVPVLALAGGKSPKFAGAIHDRLVSELPNATALVLPEAGHLVQRNEPDLLVGVLGTFLLERNVPST